MLYLVHVVQKSITYSKRKQKILILLCINLLEYSDNYSITLRGLWNYYRDRVNDTANENDAAIIE